jgi:hypothetical protein
MFQAPQQDPLSYPARNGTTDLPTVNWCQLLLLLRSYRFPVCRYPGLVCHSNHPWSSQLYLHFLRIIRDGKGRYFMNSFLCARLTIIAVRSSYSADYRRYLAKLLAFRVCRCRNRQGSYNRSRNWKTCVNLLLYATYLTLYIVMIVSACMFILGYASTWAPGIWILIGETFATRTRAKQGALATASNWLWNFLLAFFTPFIVSAINFRYGFVFACTFFFPFSLDQILIFFLL